MNFAYFDSFLKKYFWLSAAMVFLLPVVLVSILAAAPFWEKYFTAQSALAERNAVLESKQKEISDLNSTWKKISALSVDDIKKLEELLPADKNIENLLQIFEDKAEANGFILKNIDFSEAKAKDGLLAGKVKTLKIAANFSGGDYAAFKNLLADLEKNTRLIDVASVNFAAKNNNYALNLNSYWQGDAGSAAGRLDDEFFDNPIFKGLKSSQVELKAEPIGKENPFK